MMSLCAGGWMVCCETEMLLTHFFPVDSQATHLLQHVHFVPAWEKRWGCFSVLFQAWNWKSSCEVWGCESTTFVVQTGMFPWERDFFFLHLMQKKFLTCDSKTKQQKVHLYRKHMLKLKEREIFTSTLREITFRLQQRYKIMWKTESTNSWSLVTNLIKPADKQHV